MSAGTEDSLEAAVRNLDVRAVSSLLAVGGNSCLLLGQDTLLHLAVKEDAWNDHKLRAARDVCQMLLADGAQKDALDSDGSTAWHTIRMLDKDGLDDEGFNMVDDLMDMLFVTNA